MLPDPTSLRCFELAADFLNFRVAAAQAALSPATFSDRMQRLEADLGVRLFERTTRSVRLTPEGERLLPLARQSLAELRRLVAAAQPGAAPEAFTLTLGTRWELGLSWLVPALAGLRAAVPERTVHLIFGDSPELLVGVRRGLTDAAITSMRVKTLDLVAEPLHDEAYVFVGAPGLPPLRTASDAPRHTLLDTNPELPLFRYLLDSEPSPDPWVFGATELLGAIGAVRARCLAGAGVAVLPLYFVDADLRAGTLVSVGPERTLPHDTFRLWWRRGHPRTPALRTLAAELRAVPLR